MAIVKIIKGDLIKMFKEGRFQAIGHGANCRQLMGAGIARQIASQLPEAFKADAEFYTRMGGLDNNPCFAMGGQISAASVQLENEKLGRVINMYTQVKTGAHASYQLLQRACEKLNSYCKQRSITRVGLPLVGAGIGGLDVMAVATIIGMATPDIDVTLVVWTDDELNWKKLQRGFKNYGFPHKFDGLVIRTGQNTFKLFSKAHQEWVESILDLNVANAMWEQGETAIHFCETSPEVWLVVGAENAAKNNLDRLY